MSHHHKRAGRFYPGESGWQPSAQAACTLPLLLVQLFCHGQAAWGWAKLTYESHTHRGRCCSTSQTLHPAYFASLSPTSSCCSAPNGRNSAGDSCASCAVGPSAGSTGVCEVKLSCAASSAVQPAGLTSCRSPSSSYCCDKRETRTHTHTHTHTHTKTIFVVVL